MHGCIFSPLAGIMTSDGFPTPPRGHLPHFEQRRATRPKKFVSHCAHQRRAEWENGSVALRGYSLNHHPLPASATRHCLALLSSLSSGGAHAGELCHKWYQNGKGRDMVGSFHGAVVHGPA